jgi:hypothetical protein
MDSFMISFFVFYCCGQGTMFAFRRNVGRERQLCGRL